MAFRNVLRSASAAAIRPSAARFMARASVATRSMSTTAAKPTHSSKSLWNQIGFIGLSSGVAAAAYLYFDSVKSEAKASQPNWAKLREEIADVMDDENYDDGSLGPVFVRLAWHAAGTFDPKHKIVGGSSGATMRFGPEAAHGANNGLAVARTVLETIHKRYPEVSYGDLWTLAGVVAIEKMGGPVIPWRAGRKDAADEKACPPDGRLPDASKAQDHVRAVFNRMGFNDQEIVALVGAHAIGRCHRDRSGYEGPWTFAPTTFSNEYFKQLLDNKWTERKWNGPKQYQDPTGELMMLPADMVIVQDAQFKKYAEAYAKDEALFFKDFAKAFSKLLELGVKF